MPAITRIQVRRDTTANWTSTNPTLYAGEIGYVTSGADAGKFKVGDGTTVWSSLAYFSTGSLTNPMTTTGDIIYGGASGTPTRLGIGTAGQVLKVATGGTTLEWATDATGMTNPMTTAGDIIYGGASGTPTRLGLGTAGQVLKVNSGATSVEWGTDSASAYETVTLTSSVPYSAPTVVGTSTQNLGTGTTATFTLPSGMQAGDLCIVLVGSDGAGPAALPSGWTSLNNTASGSCYQRIFYKTIVAETTVNLTNLLTASAAVAIAFRNAGTPTIATPATGATGSPNSPSVTTTLNNSIVVAAAVVDDDTTGTVTAPTGYSNLASISGGATPPVAPTISSVMLATKVVETAAAEDPSAWGFSSTVDDEWVAHSLIVPPSTATENFNVSTSQILYNTGTSAINVILNFRGNASTTLNSLLSVNESVTCAYLFTNGATAYKVSEVDIDGTTQTVKWSNGSAPTGSASSIDSYVFTIIKTAANTYTVLGGSTKYA